MIAPKPVRSYTSRKKTSFLPFVLIFAILVGVILIFQNGKHLSFFGKKDQKTKLELESQKLLNEASLPEKQVRMFSELSEEYFEKNQFQAEAYYFLSLSCYLKLSQLSGNLDSIALQKLTAEGVEAIYGDSKETKRLFDCMFRNSLKAKAIDPTFSSKSYNSYLIFFSELLRKKKEPSFLAQEALKFSPESFPVLLQKQLLFYRIYLVLLANSKLDFPKTVANKDFATEREWDFFKGIFFFNRGQFLEAIQEFRKAMTDMNDSITVRSKLYEASIFEKQNLPEKSLQVLEKLYEDTGKQEERVRKQVLSLLEKFPNLKPKLRWAE